METKRQVPLAGAPPSPQAGHGTLEKYEAVPTLTFRHLSIVSIWFAGLMFSVERQ